MVRINDAWIRAIFKDFRWWILLVDRFIFDCVTVARLVFNGSTENQRNDQDAISHSAGRGHVRNDNRHISYRRNMVAGFGNLSFGDVDMDSGNHIMALTCDHIRPNMRHQRIAAR